MKLLRSVYILYEILVGADRAKALQMLHQQRAVLSRGIEVWAEIINISLLPELNGKLQPVKLSVKLKSNNDRFIYTATRALVSCNNIPQKGQLWRIKYLPGDLSVIVLL